MEDNQQREVCCSRCICVMGTSHPSGYCNCDGCSHSKCECHAPTPPVHEGGSEEWRRELAEIHRQYCTHPVSSQYEARKVEELVEKLRQSAIEEERARILSALPKEVDLDDILPEARPYYEVRNTALKEIRTAITNNREITK